MNFFIPQTKKRELEATYEGMVDTIKDQLKLVLSPRRIFSIAYTHDKKEYFAQVGQLDQQEGRYEIAAIFEANPFVMFTRTRDGAPGVMILVNKDEITKIEDFS